MNTKPSRLWIALLSSAVALPMASLHADIDDSTESDDQVYSFDEGVNRLEMGWEDVYVSVEGIPLSVFDEDDYRFSINGTEVLLDPMNANLVLTLGEAIRVNGELEWADDEDQAFGFVYELDAYTIRDLEGNIIASTEDDVRDDDEDDYIDDEDEDYRDDDSDDTRDDDYLDEDDQLVSLEEAIARLEQGYDEAYISVEGTPVAFFDDDDYVFAIGNLEVILELWDDDLLLTLEETIRVTGELEWADSDDQAAGYLYELDAMWIEDLEGNRIELDDADDSDDGSNDSRDDDDLDNAYGDRAEGTLSELIDILEMRQDDDLNVRVTGILGEQVTMVSDDDDEDYLFSDDSGVTVVLDLDSRADVHFSLTPGMAIEVIGELERVDGDDAAPEGILYELDAIWIRLADGTSMDIGQMTPLAGSTVSDWIGYFWKLDDDDDYYFHPSKGLVYSEHELGEDDWFLSLDREDWIYTTPEAYPFVFSLSEGWHYIIGSSYGELQHGYSYDEAEWVMDFWRQTQ